MAIAQTVGGYTTAVIIAITLQVLPGLAVGDRRTRHWIKRVTGRLEAGSRDEK